MTKEAAKCDACLKEMKENSESIHKEIQEQTTKTLTDVVDRVNESITTLSDRLDVKAAQMVAMVKWWIGISLTFTFFLAGGFAIYAVKINAKADKDAVVTLNEFKLINELGDEYERNVYVKKDAIRNDTATYVSTKKLVYGSVLRGERMGK